MATRRLTKRSVLCAAMGLAAALWAAPAAADAGQLAFVQDDATLRVAGRTVRLYGIHIPETSNFCRGGLQPVRCASRAALALDFRIQGFVYCDPVTRRADGSLDAVCRVDGRGGRNRREDLAAYLLRHGWAVALPGAPIEYVTLERIARAHGRGIWGFQADSIIFR